MPDGLNIKEFDLIGKAGARETHVKTDKNTTKGTHNSADTLEWHISQDNVSHWQNI